MIHFARAALVGLSVSGVGGEIVLATKQQQRQKQR